MPVRRQTKRHRKQAAFPLRGRRQKGDALHRILLTGGAGYIGSHTAVELIRAGYEVIIADDLSNSDAAVIDRIEAITGVRPDFYQMDVAEPAALDRLFAEGTPDAVIHFAGYKAVGESVAFPLRYYRNNLDTTLTLLETMARHRVKQFVFSSSSTVYSLEAAVPFREGVSPLGCTSPYGWSKLMTEQILQDGAAADPSLSVVSLRYFNPIGAHDSGLLGEQPGGAAGNLMPCICQVAQGVRAHLQVFGDDYPTPDGTGIRDYLHVVDLARGHVSALSYSRSHQGFDVFNLGTGRGVSVLDLVHTFEAVSGVTIPLVITGRRAGDVPSRYADTGKAQRLLGWRAEKSLEDMCRDAWRWQQGLGPGR